MKILFVLFIVSLIVPTDVRPFEVKKAGRAVPASRLDEIKKSTSKTESDQMTKLQEQILKRMYEQKLAQGQEGGSELPQDDIVADVIAEAESPAPVPSEELLNDAQGPSVLSGDDRQPEDISSELPDPEVIVPVEEGQIPSSVDAVQEPEVAPVIPKAPLLPLRDFNKILQKSQHERKEKTQIEAHLSLSGVRKKIKKSYFQDLVKKEIGFGDLPEMVQQMNSQAQKLGSTHYDFYHAQTPTLRVNQDVYKAFYEFFAIRAKIKDFIFLRCKDPVFGEIDTAEDFLKKQFKEHGIIDDNKVNYFILSVNLSPFGNTGIPGESTYSFYATGTGIMDPAKQSGYLSGIFKTFGLDEKFIPRVQEIGRSIDTMTGSFFQIFVPKNLVDKIGYLAWRLGIPLNQEKIEEIFGESGLFMKYEDLQNKVNEIRRSFAENKYIHTRPLNELLESVTTDQHKVSKFLDIYRSNPVNIMNYVQARLVFTSDILLNPDSGVIIYRYTDVPPEKYETYEKELAELINEILIDWLERNSDSETTSLSGGDLDRVKNLLAGMKAGRKFEGQDQAPAGKDILSKVRVLQELKEKKSEIAASSEKQSNAVMSLEQRLEQERQERMRDVAVSDKNAFVGFKKTDSPKKNEAFDSSTTKGLKNLSPIERGVFEKFLKNKM